MPSQRSLGLVLLGWIGVLVVAALMLLVRGPEERGAAIAFAIIALVMAGVTWRWWNGAVIVATLVLGVVWTVQFVAYAIAGAIDDEFEGAVFAADLVGVAAGVLLVAGAVRGLLERRRRGDVPTA